MATINMALDAIGTDFTLANGYGHIVGMALTVQGLRDQGFASGTYRGNRLSTIDTSSAGWDSGCQPGWYKTTNGVQLARPMTNAAQALETMRNKGRAAHAQLLRWDHDVTFHGPGHADWQRAFAHDALASAHGHVYLTLHDTSISVADRSTYLDTLILGASDGSGGLINSAESFYAVFTTYGLYRSSYADTSYWAWVDPATPGTALTLNALNGNSGTIPSGTVLGYGATWINDITA